MVVIHVWEDGMMTRLLLLWSHVETESPSEVPEGNGPLGAQKLRKSQGRMNRAVKLFISFYQMSPLDALTPPDKLQTLKTTPQSHLGARAPKPGMTQHDHLQTRHGVWCCIRTDWILVVARSSTDREARWPADESYAKRTYAMFCRYIIR